MEARTPGEPPVSARRLPVQLTAFVGRQRELAAVACLLAEQRLVTLTGAGGMGKSRLALEAAARASDAFPDGVGYADVSRLTEAALVPASVAASLGVAAQGGRSAIDALAHHLSSRSTLLVLDGCEHLLDACAALLDALLRAASGLRVLATSQAPLGAEGETVWRVPPLAVAPPAGAAEAQQADAVRLFLARAAAAGGAVGDEDAPAVTGICERLEGIPLAIELAAARTRALSLREIADRLDDSLALLTGGSRTAPARHRTLRAAIDWSHALLSPAEQRLFARLAVCAGWDAAAAAAVCAEGPDACDAHLDLLTALVDKSLVVADVGRGRYRMLDPLRRYARDRLADSGALADAERAHARHYLALADAAEPELRGPGQLAWSRRLDAEHDNVRAAFVWGVRHAPGRALRAAGSLYLFWLQRHVDEGRELLARLLATEEAVEPLVRARALATAGALAGVQADHAAARALLEAAVEAAARLGDSTELALALLGLGAVDSFDGDTGRARRRLAQSLATARAAGDAWNAARAEYLLAEIAAGEGERDAGRRGFMASLRAFRRAGDRWGTAYALRALGDLAHHAGQHDQARRMCARAAALGAEVGDPALVAWARWCQGCAALAQGQGRAAVRSFAEALAAFRERGEQDHVARVLTGLAGVAAAWGDSERALRLAGAAEEQWAAAGFRLARIDRAELDRWLEPAARALGPIAADAARAAGRALSLDEATADGLALAAAPRRGSLSPLTGRESEVAELIAHGATNRAIGERLGISERTVERHVENAMARLGVSSRARIASWVSQSLRGDIG